MLDSVSSANQYDPLVPARYNRWMDALETAPDELKSWMLTQGNVTLTERFVAGDENPLRFLPRNAAPRVEWFPCALSAENPERAFELMMEMASGRQTGLIVESVEESSCETQADAATAIVFESSNKLIVRTQSDKSGWLLVRDMYYPGWRATLSGASLDILAGNYLFRAVNLPAGENEVVFEYSPASFRLGSVLTIFGLLLAGAFTFRLRREEL